MQMLPFYLKIRIHVNKPFQIEVKENFSGDSLWVCGHEGGVTPE